MFDAWCCHSRFLCATVPVRDSHTLLWDPGQCRCAQTFLGASLSMVVLCIEHRARGALSPARPCAALLQRMALYITRQSLPVSQLGRDPAEPVDVLYSMLQHLQSVYSVYRPPPAYMATYVNGRMFCEHIKTIGYASEAIRFGRGLLPPAEYSRGCKSNEPAASRYAHV
jgi:hypothetical protein